MKKSALYSGLVVLLFLVSCGPVLPMPVATVPATTRAAPSPLPSQHILPWPSLKTGWTTFPSIPTITETAYDPAGYIWAITSKRLYRWNIDTSAIRYYAASDGLPDNLSAITVYDGQVWVASMKGEVAYLSGDKWILKTILPGSYFRFYAAAARLWLVNENNAYSFDGDRWKLFDSIPGDYNYIAWIAGSKDGSYWFSVYSDGSFINSEPPHRVLRFDGQTWKNYDNLTSVSRVLTTSDGLSWFISDDLLISFDGHNLTPLVLPGNYFRYDIQNSFLTPEGELWLQTLQGTFIIQARNAKKLDFDGFGTLPETVSPMPIALTPRGWLFQADQNVYLYSGAAWRKYGLPDVSLIGQLVGNFVLGFAPDGALWVLKNNEPARFDGQEIDTSYKFDLQDKSSALEYASPSYIDASGVLWTIDLEREALYFGKLGQNKVEEVYLHEPLTDFSLAPDGTVWVALTNGFITYISPADVKSRDFMELELNKIKIGGEQVARWLKPSRIVVASDGGVWVYTDNGLYKYTAKRWDYFGIPNLADSSDFAIGANNKIWAGFDYNLFEYDGKQWQQHPHNCIFPSNLTIAPDQAVWFINGCDGVYRFDGKDWTHFAKEKELAGLIPNRIRVAPDGAIWFFAPDGWARYKPGQ